MILLLDGALWAAAAAIALLIVWVALGGGASPSALVARVLRGAAEAVSAVSYVWLVGLDEMAALLRFVRDAVIDALLTLAEWVNP